MPLLSWVLDGGVWSGSPTGRFISEEGDQWRPLNKEIGGDHSLFVSSVKYNLLSSFVGCPPQGILRVLTQV